MSPVRYSPIFSETFGITCFLIDLCDFIKEKLRQLSVTDICFSLQHVVDPMKEERVQLDQSLTVWIVEAKHLPKKR